MNTKTMKGLIGARTNIELVNTPIRVYKEARLKGDTATMERAMGYAGEFAGKAAEYKTVADKGMKEDAKEAREQEELRREEAIEKRKEKREKLEEKIEEQKEERKETDIVEVSEEGQSLLKNSMDLNSEDSSEVNTDTLKEAVIYTNAGKPIRTEPAANIAVSI